MSQRRCGQHAAQTLQLSAAESRHRATTGLPHEAQTAENTGWNGRVIGLSTPSRRRQKVSTSERFLLEID